MSTEQTMGFPQHALSRHRAPYQNRTAGIVERVMKTMPELLTPLKISLFYALLGSLWIFGSDRLLSDLVPDPQLLIHLASIKGTLFVIISALLIYLLVSRLTRRLARSEELLSRVFEASSNGIAVIRDLDRRYLLVNTAFSSMSGYTDSELVGQLEGDVNLWHKSNERSAMVRRLQQSGEVNEFEATFVHRDGSLRHGIVSARQITFEEQPCTIVFVQDITLQKQISLQVEELTRFDAITGLPNHNLLMERLEHLISINSRDSKPFTVISIALARCPVSGHESYNELLRTIAIRMRTALRETDTLAVPYHGEFTALLPRTATEQELLPVVNKLLECVREPIILSDGEYQLQGHIGISVFPADGRGPEALLNNARLAMVQAQECLGENCFQFYSESMNRSVSEQLQLEAGILQGIRRGEFFLNYQPLFDRDGKSLISIEALVRWRHPALGLVGPDRFISIAEQNGTIVPLGELVMELAVQNCRHWREMGHPNLNVAVNLSPRQLRDPHFVERVAALLQRTDLPSAALCFELTETALMDHNDEIRERIFRLKELGVKLAIDDFGTGYSSLVYLKHLPVDVIKIDRSFVRDLVEHEDDRAIVAAIVAMAKSMNLKIVAEGVEKTEQHRLLRELGCDQMQGYLFGRPMERDSFEQFLLQDCPPPSVMYESVEVEEPECCLQTMPSETPAESNSRIFDFVWEITLQIPPVHPGDRLTTVLERFQSDKQLKALPVVDDGQVKGIMNRSEFIEEQILGRIGYAFHINHAKKVRDLMHQVPLVLDADTGIEEAARTIQGLSAGMRLDNICVARRGRYMGMLDLRTLMDAITALNLKLAKGANPLTGLPGNESIQREINRCLTLGAPFDIAYIDIDNFKPYNDFYGFERGDMAIRVVGDILKQFSEEPPVSMQKTFCGHIGGDDFIIITAAGQGVELAQRLISDFETRLPLLHGAKDHATGYYVSTNRKGEQETFSLLSLSIAIISVARRAVESYAQLASMATEVKKSAKAVKGSSVVVRKRDGDGYADTAHAILNTDRDIYMAA